MSAVIAQAQAALEIPHPTPDRKISYRGTRDQLIAAGVAVLAMFPEPPQRRRWSRSNPSRSNPVADDFAVTQKGGSAEGPLYTVTRELGWQDPQQLLRKKAARKVELERKQARSHARYRIERELQRDEDTTAESYAEHVEWTTRAAVKIITDAISGRDHIGWRCAGYQAILQELERVREMIEAADVIEPPCVQVLTEGGRLRVEVNGGAGRSS